MSHLNQADDTETYIGPSLEDAQARHENHKGPEDNEAETCIVSPTVKHTDHLPAATRAGKQEAKRVCKNITRLLRDRQSNTRGSRMFQKRRRRSERFAIVGYGTQPAEEEKNQSDTSSSSEKEDSDSVFPFSTDDEISVYDKPGPDNVLERDQKLSPAQQIVQKQHRNLAADAMNMKGKGAKLFARRQERMEKFVVQGKKPETSNSSGEVTSRGQTASPGPIAFVNQAYNPREQEDQGSYTPVSFNNIHSTSGGKNHSTNAGSATNGISGLQVQAKPTPQLCKFRPAEKQPWVDDGQNASFTSADWSSEDEQPQRNIQLSYESDQGHSRPRPRNKFKSVKAPTKNVNKLVLQPPIQPQPTNLYETKATTDASFYTKPEKSWTSVKFQPKASGSLVTKKADKGPSVAYPCSWASETIPTPKSPRQSAVASTWRPPTRAQVAQLTKNNPMSPKQSMTHDIRAPSPSVALLQEPIRQRSPSPYQRSPQRPQIITPVSPNTTVQSVNGSKMDQIPPSTPLSPKQPISDNMEDSHTLVVNLLGVQDKQNEDLAPSAPAAPPPSPRQTSYCNGNASYTPTNQHPLEKAPSCMQTQKVNSLPTQEVPSTKQSVSYNSRSSYAPLSKPPEEEKKPKIAACIKLLDPTKGMYQPKMELVYKSSPSLGAILDEESKGNVKDRPPSRNSYTPHFNKPVTGPAAAPQVSYLQNTNADHRHNDHHQAKPQALGSIAGGMKGKGAKMFEKQQKRMDRYTKECNGSKDAKIALPQVTSWNNQKVAPDSSSRKQMNNVMGEFRKVSDSDSPRRPSANRKGKSKDPFHYQQFYVARRPPSAADFVSTDDVASDSNNSATSSMTSSYDLGSTSSSGRPTEQAVQDDVFTGGALSPKGPPPKVAPKPDLSRFLSSESNPNTVVAYEEDVKQIEENNQNDQGTRHEINENGPQEQTNQESSEVFTSGNQTTKAKSYAVWAPGTVNSTPDVTALLPPPPSYNEVTSSTISAPKPTFTANRVPCSTFDPTSPNNSVINTNQGVMPPTVQRVAFSPKPRFVSSAKSMKWTPSCDL